MGKKLHGVDCCGLTRLRGDLVANGAYKFLIGGVVIAHGHLQTLPPHYFGQGLNLHPGRETRGSFVAKIVEM